MKTYKLKRVLTQKQGGKLKKKFLKKKHYNILITEDADGYDLNGNLLFKYRKYLEGKEDRDFAMQVIKSGQTTARTTLYAFNAPTNGSNAGGLKEIFYDTGKEEIAVSRMVEVWGENICVPIVKPSGRNDIKIMWKKINSNQLEIF